MVIACEYCGLEVEAQRRTKRFCSETCAQRKRRGWPTTRECRHCGTEFEVRTRADANRQHCSKQCAKNHHAKQIRGWNKAHPEAMSAYNRRRKENDPFVWKHKFRGERLESLRLLGDACIVCGVTNPAWLHIDFIPTTRGMKHRHPRHNAYVREHLNEFRILCANHHYELTLTGHIEGTDIYQ